MSTIKQARSNCNRSVFLTSSSLVVRSGVNIFLNYPFAVNILNTCGPIINCENGKWIQLSYSCVQWCVCVITLLCLLILLP
jgi:hypothetical protein